MSYLRRHCPPENEPAQRFLSTLRDVYFVTPPSKIPPEFVELCELHDDYNIKEAWKRATEYRLSCYFDLGDRIIGQRLLEYFVLGRGLEEIISFPSVLADDNPDYKAFIEWLFTPLAWRETCVFAASRGNRFNCHKFNCYLTRILDFLLHGVELE